MCGSSWMPQKVLSRVSVLQTLEISAFVSVGHADGFSKSLSNSPGQAQCRFSGCGLVLYGLARQINNLLNNMELISTAGKWA